MEPLVSPEIERYAIAHTDPEPEHLRVLAEETRRLTAAPQMMVGPLEGRFLEALVALSGATRILEIGTFTGYSALSMAAALPPGGRITTCEISEEHAAIARRHIAASPWADQIDVRLGPAADTIAGLDGPFDLVFIDADKGGYLGYYEAVLPKLADGGVIVADNLCWSGQVVNPSFDDADTEALRAFADHVRADPRATSVLLTVRDGMLLIRRAPA
jgi:caffeoyl-CoA O-methyltransferase